MFGLKIFVWVQTFRWGPPCPRATSATLSSIKIFHSLEFQVSKCQPYLKSALKFALPFWVNVKFEEKINIWLYPLRLTNVFWKSWLSFRRPGICACKEIVSHTKRIHNNLRGEKDLIIFCGFFMPSVPTQPAALDKQVKKQTSQEAWLGFFS